MDDQTLFQTYKEDVFRYCLHMLRNRTDAEDICQEVFVKAMLADRSKVEHIKAWLMRIAANECHSLMRRRTNGNQKEKKAFTIHLPLRASQSVENEYERAETAEALNVPIGTAKSRINRGLKMLKKLYDKTPNSHEKGSDDHVSSY